MSFTIQLYNNKSPSNFVNKSIELIGSGTGTLRESTSILNPVVTFSTVIQSQLISSANYAYIDEFNRYYYITDIVSVVNGMWSISLHVDVLMTYKNGFRGLKAIVARQEHVYNMYLDDGWFMAYQNPIIETIPFSAAAPFDSEEYIMIIAGS